MWCRGDKSLDAAETLRVFQETVTVMAAADYTPEQIAAPLS